MYFSNSTAHSSSVDGSLRPSGRQSTMLRPERVRRVSPPSVTMPNTMAVVPASQIPTAFFCPAVGPALSAVAKVGENTSAVPDDADAEDDRRDAEVRVHRTCRSGPARRPARLKRSPPARGAPAEVAREMELREPKERERGDDERRARPRRWVRVRTPGAMEERLRAARRGAAKEEGEARSGPRRATPARRDSIVGGSVAVGDS